MPAGALAQLSSFGRLNAAVMLNLMTSTDFRRIALSMPEAYESAHMGHPDFRVTGKIFATLGYPDERCGVVLLPLEEQERFLRTHPLAFAPVKGAWGRRGDTQIVLDAIDSSTLQAAIAAAHSAKQSARLRNRRRGRESKGV
jgi:hypothetical protein